MWAECHREPEGMMQYIDMGLAVVRNHSIAPEGVADVTEKNCRADYIALPAASTSVIRHYSRIPLFSRSDLSSTVDRDYLWVYQDEVRSLVKRAQEAAKAGRTDFSLPPTLVARLVRFHLVDNGGGRQVRFDGPNEVKKVDFTAHLDPADPAHFSFVGSWKAGTNQPDWYDVQRAKSGLLPLLTAAQNAPTPDEDTRLGIEGQIQGDFTVNKAALRITRFVASAQATAWGGGSPGHTEMPPPGKFPIVYAFIGTDDSDSIARGVPPSFAYHPAYKHGYYWLLPGIAPTATVEPTLDLAPILGKFITEVEQTIGPPKSIGVKRAGHFQERYYKVDGFIRVIIEPSPNERIGVITIQFPRHQVKDWREALMRVGLPAVGGEDSPPGRSLTFPLAGQYPPSPQSWLAHWQTPGISGNDTLILERSTRE